MTMINENLKWIAVDWGTSNLRVWLMGDDKKILKHLTSDQGMGVLKPLEFEPALIDLIDGYLPTDKVTTVIASGMVGAKQGWFEATYITVPCDPQNASCFVSPPFIDPRIKVFILPGVKQLQPADVMRGEETQIAGFLEINKDFDGIVCLPGTHSKWVRIFDHKITRFQTFMTGELFALLANNSILSNTVAQTGWDAQAFLDASDEAITNPQDISAKLFTLRAEALVTELSPASARARLSGLLIGVELASTQKLWREQDIAIIGAPKISKAYQDALASQNIKASLLDTETMTLAGLGAAFNSMKDIS